MNKKTMEKILLAKKYQCMAIKALLPEQAGRHVDTIAEEVTSLLTELLSTSINHDTETASEKKTGKTTVHNVTIQ